MSREVRLVMCHGINTPPTYPFHIVWLAKLLPELNRRGIRIVQAMPVRWDSSGEILPDIKRTLSPLPECRAWRRMTRREIVSSLVVAIDNGRRDGARVVVIAHSMGTVLVADALREIARGEYGEVGERALDVGVLFIGSPLSHPSFSVGLKMSGYGRPTPQTPINFYNEDDGVSGWKNPVVGPRVILPRWCINKRIAIAGDPGWVIEHDARKYLGHGAVTDAVELLATSRREPSPSV